MCSRAQPRTHTSSLERQRLRTCQQQHRCGLIDVVGYCYWLSWQGGDPLCCAVGWDCLPTMFARHARSHGSTITLLLLLLLPPAPPCCRRCTTQSQAAQAFQMNAAEDMPESRPAAAASELGTQPHTQGACLVRHMGPSAFSSRSLNQQAVVQGARACSTAALVFSCPSHRACSCRCMHTPVVHATLV